MRSRTRGKLIAIWLIVLVLAGGGGYAIFRLRQGKEEKTTYRTAKVEMGTVTSTVSANGVLQPLTTVDVKSNVGGTVTELAVDEGDTVIAGQLLARIDPSDTQTALEQSQADNDAAASKVSQSKLTQTMQRQQNEAQVQSAAQALAAAQARLAQAQEQDKLQPSLTTNAIAQAEQNLLSAKARLAQAQAQATLQPQLTASAIKQAEQNLAAAKAKLEQALDQAEVQPGLTDSAIAQAESNLAAAKSAYSQTKNASVPQKLSSVQAAFDQANATYAYTQKDLARQKALLAKGFVASSVVDDAEERNENAKAQLSTARNKLDTVKGETAEDLQSAQAKVDQAAAALKTAQANRAQDRLKQRDVDVARTAVAQADAALKTAKDNQAQDGVKQQDVEAAKAAVAQAEAALKSAKDNRAQDRVKTQDVDAARASVAQAKAALASAKAGLEQNLIREGDITQARAQVVRTQASLRNARTQLGYTTITAPRAGVVVTKYVEAGSIVTAGRSSMSGSGAGVSLVQIADTTRMFALVNVDETDVAQISIGQAVDITLDAYPNELFDGKVTKIAPQASMSQNVTIIPVTVEIDMPDARLKPGMNVTCDFIAARQEHVLTVPNEAIKESDDGSTVQVMVNGVPETRNVTIGLQGNDASVVEQGLKGGEEVVTATILPQKKTKSSSTGMSPFGGPMGGGTRSSGRGH